MIQVVNNPFPRGKKVDGRVVSNHPFNRHLNFDDPETVAYKTIGGEVIIPPRSELDRIFKENVKAAQDLNPAHKYFSVWVAGHAAGDGLPYKEHKNKLEGLSDDPLKVAAEINRRATLTRKILASAPENFI